MTLARRIDVRRLGMSVATPGPSPAVGGALRWRRVGARRGRLVPGVDGSIVRFHGPLHAGEVAQSRHSVAVGRGLRPADAPPRAPRAIRPDRRATTLAQMARLVLLLGAVDRGCRRPRPSRRPRQPRPGSARRRRRTPVGLVEAVLGRKPVAPPAHARLRAGDRDELGAADRRRVVLPAAARGHRGGDVGRPHPDLRVQGRRDRQPVPRPPGREGRRRCRRPGHHGSGVQPAGRSGRRRSTTRSSRAASQVVANEGAFLDLDGLLQDRKIDWRFDDLGHFDHRKVVVDRRPGRLRRRARASRTTTRPGRTT